MLNTHAWVSICAQRWLFVSLATLRPGPPSGTLVRLVGGEGSREGILQVSANGIWAGVAPDSLDSVQRAWLVDKACQALGWQRGKQFPSGIFTPTWKPRMQWVTASCLGTETSIAECSWAGLKMAGYVTDALAPDLVVSCSPTSTGDQLYCKGESYDVSTCSCTQLPSCPGTHACLPFSTPVVRMGHGGPYMSKSQWTVSPSRQQPAWVCCPTVSHHACSCRPHPPDIRPAPGKW